MSSSVPNLAHVYQCENFGSMSNLMVFALLSIPRGLYQCTFKIRLDYAQALLDRGMLAAARSFLKELVNCYKIAEGL